MNRAGLPTGSRVAIVVALVAMAAVALRSRPYAAVAHGVPGGVAHWTGTVLVLGPLAVGVVLAVLFLVSRRRRRGTEVEQMPRPTRVSPWVRTIALVIVLAVFAAPVVLLTLRRRRAAGVTTLGQGVPPHAGITGPNQAPFSHSVPVMPWWPWAVLVCAALVLIAVLVRQRARAVPEPAAATGREDAPPAVVEAGLDALRRGADDDPRTAVLACYAAMERALAGTEAGPRPADTPREVVARAMDAQVVPDEAAALADLFRRARYSTHPFGEADRSHAEAALERVRRHAGVGT